MLHRFLPRTTNFFDFFERHAGLILDAAKELQALSTEVNVADHVKRVKELEHQADAVTHSCMETLYKTFITPIERGDIHRLVTALDDIIDLIDEVVERISLYELNRPSEALAELAAILVCSAEVVHRALPKLRNMKNARMVLDDCVCINELEKDGDAIYSAALSSLFKEERDPLMVIKWREVYEGVEEAIDGCEDVANILEGIVLEHT